MAELQWMFFGEFIALYSHKSKIHCLLPQVFPSNKIFTPDFSSPSYPATCFERRLMPHAWFIKRTKHDHLLQRSGSGEARETPALPRVPHPPLCPPCPSAVNFSRRKKNKGLAGLLTQCKIELVEVCEEHGSISMGMRRFLSPPPRIILYNTKLLSVLAGGHPPCEPP